MTPLSLSPLQAALNEIEARAARETANLLARQDDYLAAVALAETLKRHGAPADLVVDIIHPRHRAEFLIYGNQYDPDALRAALAAAGLAVEAVERGYSDKVRRWVIAGHPEVELYMPADLQPLPASGAEAA